jgi:hypothetical protein
MDGLLRGNHTILWGEKKHSGWQVFAEKEFGFNAQEISTRCRCQSPNFTPPKQTRTV